MQESILISIKKMLGIDEADSYFDTDVTININTSLMALSQIGVGPVEGFIVVDRTERWIDFLPATINLQAAKTYIYLNVKMLFDPPGSSFVLESMKQQVREIEWRLNVQAEGGVIQ